MLQKRYKSLQEDFEVAQKLADTHITADHKLKNMEQMVEETRKDNRNFITKIEEL